MYMVIFIFTQLGAQKSLAYTVVCIKNNKHQEHANKFGCISMQR